MNYAGRDRRILAADIPDALEQHGRTFPSSTAEWVEEYNNRYDAYLGLPYGEGLVKALHLFRALDPSGDIIDMTRRLTRDYTYVCDTDAAALYGDGWNLTTGVDVEEARAARWQADGDRVWKASRITREAQRWCKDLAILGDLYLVATKGPRGEPRIAAYRPQHVEAIYDSQGIDLERVIVRIERFDGSELDARTGMEVQGERESLGTFVKEYTATQIRTWRDDRFVAEESGRNTLGVLPVVHVPFLPFGEPEHSLNAAHGIDESMALVHSLLTQMSAIGNRYASPFYVARGFNAPAARFGHMLNNVPVDGGVDTVEPALTGIGSLLDTALRHHESIRGTLPEFQLKEASATASGEALKVRASSFLGKMQPIRSVLLDSVARVTALAVAVGRGEVWRDEYESIYDVEGGAILPMDKTAELDRIVKVREHEGMLDADFVEHLQRLGFVHPDHDPEEYAEALRAEASLRTASTVDSIRALGNAGDEPTSGPLVEVDDDSEDEPTDSDSLSPVD